jgi:hypothetical protein
MVKVSRFLKYISDQNPAVTPVRLSLYNYLRTFPHPEEELSPEIVNQFFRACMDYPHWQQNRSSLGKEVLLIFQQFNSENENDFPLEKIQVPQSVQIVEIDNLDDLVDTAKRYMERQIKGDEKFRIFLDQGRRVIVIWMRSGGAFEVRIFDKRFIIQKGLLEPLRLDMKLVYTSNLTLDPEVIQRIDIAPYITAQFKVIDEKIYGLSSRGYVFQRHNEYKGEALSQTPRVYIPVKRIEQFFIDRRTDGFYAHLVSSMEKSIQFLDSGADSEEAIQVLDLAQTALEHVYLQDRLLSVLVRDLRQKAKNKEECLPLSPISKSKTIDPSHAASPSAPSAKPTRPISSLKAVLSLKEN